MNEGNKMTDLELKKSLLTCPGDTIQEHIDHLGMSQAELAERLGRSIPKLNELIRGKAPITKETATKLEFVLGVPANFWLNLERTYQDELLELEQMEYLETCLEWIKGFPVKWMKDYGLLPNTTDKTSIADKITIHTDIHQRSEQWHEIRLGRVGGSESNVLSVKGKSASGLGAAAFTLLYEKAFEIIQGEPVKENIVTFAMQRGMDLEPEALHEYELNKMVKVDQVGYILNSDFKYAGYSPDGLVGEDGLIEVKCPGNSEFMRQIITMEIPKPYLCQMQWGMFLSGRKWCDYVVYNPDYTKSPLYVDRVDKNEKMIEVLKANYLAFESELDAILERFN